ncbi:carnosine synthase 1-like [Ruditapes philippinarum]|uniref:carnosine synthase 1-like n=1 Tax=Ruditapes philippinarum TaxID=129788 RepID=UPI00295B4525|nr:carnosine synthase 1-like [Ruditapes philippinarum]
MGVKIDGCLSFIDMLTPLVALICESLELRGLSYKSAIIANSKSQTQNVLSMNKNENDALNTGVFSSQAVHLKSDSDCEMLPESFKFPAILKLDNCAGGVGACMVKSKEEMKKQFQQITRSLCSDSAYPGIGLSRGNSMTTFEFHSGTEHNVDVILYDKTLVWASITDSGVVRQPYYIGTAKRLPSFLPDESRKKLIDAAFKCCLGIGLTDGTFNVEFIMTANGPKLVEINPRMCGYVFREWIMKLYGLDMMLYTMMISCGIKPEIPNSSTDTIQMGVMVIPSLHGKLLTDDYYKNKLSEMIDRCKVFFLQFESLEHPPTYEEPSLGHLATFEEPFGNVSVSGTNPVEVKRKLMDICRALDIDQNDYQVDTFIRNF